MSIQGWFPLGLTGLVSWLSEGLLRVFSNTTVQKHQFVSPQLSLWSLISHKHDYWKNHSFDYMDLCWQSDVSAFKYANRFVIASLARSKHLLITWLQTLSAEILEPKKTKSVTISTFSSSICHEVMGSDATILVFWMLSFKPAFFTLLFHLHRGALLLPICISEVVDISSSNLDSSLWFIQPSISHDAICI